MSKLEYQRHISAMTKRTVWLLIFGCHILVMNLISGGLKGYSFGILISTSYLPPSYGVSGGPTKLPCKFVMSSARASTVTWHFGSLWTSWISFAIRRLRCWDMLDSSKGCSCKDRRQRDLFVGEEKRKLGSERVVIALRGVDTWGGATLPGTKG